MQSAYFDFLSYIEIKKKNVKKIICPKENIKNLTHLPIIKSVIAATKS